MSRCHSGLRLVPFATLYFRIAGTLGLLVALSGLGKVASGAIAPELLIAPTGPSADDWLGYFGAPVGDFNNDGYEDIAIGAPGTNSEPGRAYVFFGGPGADGTSDLTLQGDNVASDEFGKVVAGIGDYNGDGFDDILVGADKSASTNAGRVYIFFGGDTPDGAADLDFEGLETAGNEQFGDALSAAGDLNADGYDDFIVGARWSDIGASNTDEGRAYVYFGGPDSLQSQGDDVPDLVFVGRNGGDGLGNWVADAGDLNADGYDDVVVGVQGLDIGASNAGGAYVYFGGPGLDDEPDLIFVGNVGGNLGNQADGAGDLNGDGFDDLLLGDLTNDANGTDAGRVFVYWGGPAVDTVADLILDGEAANSRFGRGLSRGGDLNGDGFDDFIVGAAGNDDPDEDRGRLYVYYGGPGVDATPDIILSGEASFDNFGFFVASVGDFNLDGLDDFLTGAYVNDEGGSAAGKAYLYAGPGSYGGCCLSGGCLDLTETECIALGGTPLPEGAFCADNDSDGDGVSDYCDECPEDPNKIFAGDCGCGVPEQIGGGVYSAQFGSSGTGDGQYQRVVAVTVDPAGRIYTCDMDNDRFQVFEPNGTHIMSVGSTGTGDGQFNIPYGIMVDDERRIWVSEAGNCRVQVFDSAGNFLFKFGSCGTASGEFLDPSGMAQDSNGDVWIVDSFNDRVQRFDRNGNFEFLFAVTSLPDTDQPINIAIDENDRMYITDRDNEVTVWDNAGTFLYTLAPVSAFDGDPRGIALGPDGNVFVTDTDTGNTKIRAFTKDGTFLYSIGSFGTGNGQFDDARGLAIDAAGRMYVADRQLDRVQIFDLIGDCPSACCLPNGCLELLPSECTSLGGTPLADGSTCSENDTDGDGVRDECDLCALDPIKIAPGDCGCDVPDGLGDAVFSTSFGGPGSGPGQFDSLVDVEVDPAGRLVTMESMNTPTGNERVQVFDASGTHQFSFGPVFAGGQLDDPVDVALDSAGNIYVLENTGGEVSVFDAFGNFQYAFGSLGSGDGELDNPLSLAIDETGRVLVTDFGNRVQVFDADGNFLFKFGSTGSGDGQFNVPHEIVTDAEGRIYVTEKNTNRIQKFTSDGVFLSSFGDPDIGGQGLGVDAMGRVYATTTMGAVQVFDAADSLVLEFGQADLTGPQGLAIARSGGIWISDFTDDSVKAFDPVAQLPELTASNGILETGTVLEWSPICNEDGLWKISRTELPGGSPVPLVVLPQSDSVYVDVSGVAETRYLYELKFVDSATGFQSTVADTGWRAVFAPTQLTATDGTREDGVLIEWNDRSSIEDRYRVLRRAAGTMDPFAVLDSTEADFQSYLDESAVGMGRFEYAVEAVSADGGVSDRISGAEGETGALNAPSNVAASDGVYTDRVLLTWNDETALEDGYIIYKRLAGTMDAFAFVDSVNADSTSFEDFTGLETAWEYGVASFLYDVGIVESPLVLDDGIGGDSTMAAPSNVMASFDDYDDRILVIWDDPGNDEDKFVIYREGSVDPIGEVSGETTQFNDTDVAPGVLTEYCVMSVSNLGGTSVLDSCATGRRAEIVPPFAVEVTDGELEDRTDITWDTQSTTTSVFQILRDSTPVAVLPPSARSYSDRGGKSGVSYRYYVRGLTVEKTPSDSTGRGVVGSRKLLAAGEVDATDGTLEKRVDIRWQDNSSVETAYRVLRRPYGSSAEGDLLVELPRNRTAYSDDTGDVGVTYEYLIVAVDGVSADTEAVADTGRRELGVVGNLTASVDEFEQQIVVEWADRSAAETAYEVWRDNVFLASLPADTTQFVDIGLPVGAAHTYQVFPVDDDAPGVGPFVPPAGTPSASGKTDILPPASVSASDTYESRVSVSWVDQSAMETGYEIGYEASPGSFIKLGEVGPNVTTYEDPSPPSAGEVRKYYARTLGSSRSSSLAFDTGQVADPPGSVPVTVVDDRFAVGDGFSEFATDGEVAVVGGDSNGARIYRRDDVGSWSLEQTISVSNAGGYTDIVGADVDGDWLVLIWENPPNHTTEVFQHDETGWTYNSFGSGFAGQADVDLDGTRMVEVYGTNSTFVVTSELNTATGVWGIAESFSLSSGAFRVAMDDDLMVYQNSSGVNVREFNGTSWIDLGPVPSFGLAGFGAGVDVSDGRVAVGGEGGTVIYDPSSAKSQLVSYGPSSGTNRFNVPQLDGDMLVIGDLVFDQQFPVGVFYDDPKDGWTEKLRIDSTDGAIRTEVSFRGGAVVFGDIAGTAAHDVFYANLLPVPDQVEASDNEFENKVRVSWRDRSATEDGFRIYRDGVAIGDVDADATTFNDFDARPGVAHEYRVAAFSSEIGELSGDADIGRRPADGFIGGRVTTRSGTGVPGVDVCLDPPAANSLFFDGNGGYVDIRDVTIASTNLTVELWATVQDLDPSTRFLWKLGRGNSTFVTFHKSASGLEVVTLGGTATFPLPADRGWHHYALAFDGTLLRFYQDGALVGTHTYSSPVTTGTYDVLIGGDPLANIPSRLDSESWMGQIDDVRMWSTTLTGEQIRTRRNQRILSDTEDLLGFWTFDEPEGLLTSDLTGSGYHGEFIGGVGRSEASAPIQVCATTDDDGNYGIPGILYGDGRTFDVTPVLAGRVFEPRSKVITIDQENPLANEVGFNDATSFSIEGFVGFSGTACVAEGVELYVDDTLVGATDANGEYEIAVLPGNHTIEARSEGLEISPTRIDLDVRTNIAGQDFEVTTRRRLALSVGGGCPGVQIGTITLNVASSDFCYEEDVTLTDTDELNLAPLEYQVTVKSVTGAQAPLSNGQIQDFFDFLGPQIADLSLENGAADFVYRAPIQLTVEGFAGVSCASFLDEAGGPVTSPDAIIGQGEKLQLTFRVEEDYGGGNVCPVDSAVVTVLDEVNDQSSPIVVPVSGGIGTYTLIGNTPNVFAGRSDAAGNNRSYQKAFTAIAAAGASVDQETRWVTVTGARPRSGTFYSGISEEFPVLILHDPPGDESFAFYEKDVERCSEITDISFEGDNQEGKVLPKLGVKFEAGTGFFNQETKAVLGVGYAMERRAEIVNDTTFVYCAKTTQLLSTADTDLFVGPQGDVFIGSAINVLFAPADNLAIDSEGSVCKARTFQEIRLGIDGRDPFPSSYAYTRGYIEQVLIPQLEVLKASATDSTEIYQSQIVNWQKHLDLADQLTAEGIAASNENRSFSAGAIFEATASADTSSVIGWSNAVYTDDAVISEFDFEVAGSGIEGGLKANWTIGTTDATVNTTDSTITTGYRLADGDIGDFFTVDVGVDPRYGTPVFDLVSGRSSCPWEAGTAPRDSVAISLGAILNADESGRVPADEPAVMTLTITNWSSELREYYIRSEEIENSGGATIKVNGIDAAVPRSFFVGPKVGATGGQKDITVSVERGPRKFSYPNLRLQAIPPCEFELFQAGDTLRLAQSVDFDVEFAAPCSDITITSPISGESFDRAALVASGDTVTIRLDDVIPQLSESAADTIEANIEWRKIGGSLNWKRVLNKNLKASDFLVEGASLPTQDTDDFLQDKDIYWDVPGDTLGTDPDAGQYELRAFTTCGPGKTVYSNVVKVRIDRQEPKAFGDPKPADGVLSFGDPIKIVFDEVIDCGTVNTQTVRLTVTGEPNPVPVDLSCSGNTVIIDPAPLGQFEGQTATVTVGQLDPGNAEQTVRDLAGNPMKNRDGVGTKESWSFDIRLSEFAWVDDSVVKATTYESGGSVLAELVNGGDLDVPFHLSATPEWLTPSDSSGVVVTGDTVPIEFTFPDTLGRSGILADPGGIVMFSTTVEAFNPDSSVVLPLDVRIDVTCGPPAWEVLPEQYEHSMTAIVQIQVGAAISSDPDDMVGAFVGSQLRGVASPQGVGGDADVAYLTIYSNRIEGEIVRFKVFDADSCHVFGATDKTVRFEADRTDWGSPVPEVLLAQDEIPGSFQTIAAKDGWTWFSTNLDGNDDLSVFTVLGDLNVTSGDLVKSQSAFSVVDDSLQWNGDLTEFNNREGYLLRLSEAEDFTIEGQEVDPDSVVLVLKPNWNWIGYTPNVSRPIDDALGALSSNEFDVIKSQTQFAQYDGSEWVGTLTDMEPGQGYKLRRGSSTPAIFRYPSNAASPGPGPRGDTNARAPLAGLTETPRSAAMGAALELGWELPQWGFQYNMSVIAEVDWAGETLRPPAVIGAFVDGEVRGVAELQQVGLGSSAAFLTVHSDESSGEALEFRVYDLVRDEILSVENELDFRADDVVGSIGSPLRLRATSGVPAGTPVVFYMSAARPNPVRSEVPSVIQYALPIDSDVSIQVYDVTGRLVERLVDGRRPAGNHQVEIDTGMLSSGVYFYRMRAGDFDKVRKLTVVR